MRGRRGKGGEGVEGRREGSDVAYKQELACLTHDHTYIYVYNVHTARVCTEVEDCNMYLQNPLGLTISRVNSISHP